MMEVITTTAHITSFALIAVPKGTKAEQFNSISQEEKLGGRIIAQAAYDENTTRHN